MLKALAMLFYGPLAQALGGTAWFGPQIASAVWALPGVVRGEDFMVAWVSEVKDRYEKLLEIYGPEIAGQIEQYIPDVQRYLNREVWKNFGDIPLEEGLRRLNISPETLSKELLIGVMDKNGHWVYRPDIAALILNSAKNDAHFYNLSEFDITTGKRPSPLPGEIVPLPTRWQEDLLTVIRTTQRDKLPGGVSIGDLTQLVEDEKKKQLVIAPAARKSVV